MIRRYLLRLLNAIDNAELNKLSDQWKRHACVAFNAAEHEQHPFGKRLINHGAVINFNHAEQLRRLVDGKS